VWILKFLLLLLAVAVGAALAVLNPASVQFDYYFGSLELSLALILALTLAVGALLGTLSALLWSLSMRRENMHLRRRLELSRQELKNLRTLPVNGR
jgi:uncharacterized integral membrane protein